jgi:hypothetical protein
MKMNRLLFLSIASLLVIGCNSKESINQPAQTKYAQSTPISTESTGAVTQDVVKSGTFIPGEHSTSGTARIVIKNGKTSLELDQSFKTSDKGPDLVVILHRSDNVLGSTKPPAYPIQQADYVVIAPLKKFSGAQNYPIPDNINLSDYKSAVIWCRQFNATFGVATLK